MDHLCTSSGSLSFLNRNGCFFYSYDAIGDMYVVISSLSLITLKKSTSDRELEFFVSKHLLKMCVETKLQPLRLRNDIDIERFTRRAKIHLTGQHLYIFGVSIIK